MTIRAGAGIVGLACVSFVVAWWFAHGFWPGDTWTYWDAGDRLLRGHALYSLAPSDPWIPRGDRTASPLLSPPAIALPWLVLSALPGATGVLVWLVAMAACAAWAIAYLLLRSGGWAGLALAPLSLSVGLLVGVGNVDAAVLAGLVLAWLALERGHDERAGVLLGVLASVKLTPAIVLVYLVAQRRWRALGWALGACVAIAALTAVVLGPGIFAEYVASLPVGVGRTWAYAVLGLGVVGLFVLRDRPRLGWALAVALIPLGSPAAAVHSWSVLLAALAPLGQTEPQHRAGDADERLFHREPLRRRRAREGEVGA